MSNHQFFKICLLLVYSLFTLRFKNNLLQMQNPLCSGIGVRFQTESLSAFKQNVCPACSGMVVRFEADFEFAGFFKVMNDLVCLRDIFNPNTSKYPNRYHLF